jgi:hypothetical protein
VSTIPNVCEDANCFACGDASNDEFNKELSGDDGELVDRISKDISYE